ncbi:MAG TPA: hypothetical protein VGA92_06160 [Candidatus Nitrosotenuis sp.]
MKQTQTLVLVIVGINVLAIVIATNLIQQQTEAEKERVRHEQQIQEIKNAFLENDIKKATNLIERTELNEEDVRELDWIISQEIDRRLDSLTKSLDNWSLPDCTPAQRVMLDSLEKRLEQSQTIKEAIIHQNQINNILSQCR